jgi:hypothetical protein
MKRHFEYKIIRFSDLSTLSLEDYLNMQGVDGWRLVCLHESFSFVLEREI